MAFTTLPTLLAGQRLTGDDIATIETALAEVRPIGAVKTGDQTNATTTIADDTELQITLAAGQTYEGTLYLLFNAPAAGDLKIQVATPSGTTGYWNPMTTAVATPGVIYLGALGIASQAQNEGTGADIFMRAGFLITTTTAGIMKAQHALNVASGTLTVKAGSILVARRVI